MKHSELSFSTGNPDSVSSGSLRAAVILYRKTRRSRFLAVLALAVMVLGILLPSYGQGTAVFNCPSGFASSGSCGVDFTGYEPAAFGIRGTTNGSTPVLSGTSVNMAPAGSQHTALGMLYQTLVNVQAFSTTFTFQPNGVNLSFVVENSSNSPDFNGSNFSAGAGCEGGFYQAFGGDPPPASIFALMIDSDNANTVGSSHFTYSSAQVSSAGREPVQPQTTVSNLHMRVLGTRSAHRRFRSINSAPANTADTCVPDRFPAPATPIPCHRHLHPDRW